MATEHYVVAGLARPRAPWFSAVAAWGTSGAVPVRFLKCVSAAELRAHLAAGRAVSAVLLDAGLPGLDRDLLAEARDAGAATLLVGDEAAGPQRSGRLGAAGALPEGFGREELLEALRAHARPVPGEDTTPAEPASSRRRVGRAPLVAVCGPGGTGASTVAIAVAQGLAAAASARRGRRRQGQRRGLAAAALPASRAGLPVCLADLCRPGEQALLHDSREVAPGVEELVEAHRTRVLSVDEVHAHTYDVVERGYHLLLGLRRARHWPAIRPRAFEAALAGLREAFRLVVCDVTADLEGEADAGSADVEERNVMARTAVAHADLVCVVGGVDTKGLASLARLLDDLRGVDVDPPRALPVLNGAVRSPRARAALAAALAELTGGAAHPGPLFLPRVGVDAALRDGVALPAGYAERAAAAVGAALRPRGVWGAEEPQRVLPGELGAWSAMAQQEGGA